MPVKAAMAVRPEMPVKAEMAVKPKIPVKVNITAIAVAGVGSLEIERRTTRGVSPHHPAPIVRPPGGADPAAEKHVICTKS